jgi:hypothetical protein
MTTWRRLWIIGICGLVSACSARLPPIDLSDEDCLASLRVHDRQVREQGVGDAQAARIEGFPFLRTSRFLASFAGQEMDTPTFGEWLSALSELDEQARAHERANLAMPPPLALGCRDGLIAEVLARPELRASVRARAGVEDAYSDLRRGLGLYPLSKWLVWSGIERLHQDTRQGFAVPPANDAVLRYTPADSYEPAERPLPAARDGLGRLHIDPDRLSRLFAYFAPVIVVASDTAADRIGAPRWDTFGRLAVDAGRPRVYRQLSYTRFQDRILPQLNYVFWFPARPKAHVLALLGGELDGLTWRLTLGEDGRVLLADSMHNCGCYHMFFPSSALQIRSIEDGTEPALIPSTLPELEAGQRYVLHLSSGAHYIQAVATTDRDAAADVHYGLDDYDVLRSLPVPSGGRRSLFGPDGLVAGSERLERFLLWPMGVSSAGAMRQWGHHATAFVGRRHFDDVDLLDRYFEAAAVSSAP